ncbi:putative membrane protein [Natrinema pellirubrum DSM 15624]|uniref:Membrane protein n=1 Tax=Natrinema pellirubrum (strain DSM 15624 / CIP 106293 / JCM 10476 / NCIMB 786 / 157) TaxID=797303 RepID=L0JI51_NATP1|nr:lysine exporter LysO family protein [Natrinema pellirubrum]AGB31205.1 putative membrane protein [Natrinema pellirubrum DSM 15624]ELY81431.1 putative membrane protein [Natrinema pellirubrum DSM 15624]
MSIGTLLLALVVGSLVGYYTALHRIQEIGDAIIFSGLAVLLVSIGTQLGGDEQILQDLNTIGGSALVLCLGSIIGSVACVYLLITATSIGDPESASADGTVTRPDTPSELDAGGFDWKVTGLIVVSLTAGLGLSAVGLPEHVITRIVSISDYALLALLFGVGITVGGDTEAVSHIVRIGWGVLLIPVAVAVGSILGGVLLGAVIGMPVTHAAAVAAGFGWYSYAGVVVFDLGGVELGTIAFLANLFREIVTFLVLPAVAKYLGGVTSIAPGGATTMDVTLPLIQRVSGERFVIPALINGLVLSVAATVLVPTILGI